jgi:hypothetical protein
LWIYLANVFRLIIVIVVVHLGGANVFYLAHSILGRIAFYLLIIALYYNVFTYSRLSRGLYKTFKERLKRV